MLFHRLSSEVPPSVGELGIWLANIPSGNLNKDMARHQLPTTAEFCGRMASGNILDALRSPIRFTKTIDTSFLLPTHSIDMKKPGQLLHWVEQPGMKLLLVAHLDEHIGPANVYCKATDVAEAAPQLSQRDKFMLKEYQ
jgi:hypothetical protein